MSRGSAVAIVEKKSFCRICSVGCGMVLSIDEEQQRLVEIHPDKSDTTTLGYACSKGIHAVDQHYGEGRLLKPLKRMPDGSFAEIALEQALDEIAEKLRIVVDRDGGEAVAGFRGSGAYMNGMGVTALPDFLQAFGSRKIFSGFTIDQSAKVVAIGRTGLWPAGPHPFTAATSAW